MDLRRMAILMLVLAAVCGLVAYESYRFNVVAVEKFAANAETGEMFTEIKAGIPPRSKITGFLAIMFGVAGAKMLFTSRSDVGENREVEAPPET